VHGASPFGRARRGAAGDQLDSPAGFWGRLAPSFGDAPCSHSAARSLANQPQISDRDRLRAFWAVAIVTPAQELAHVSSIDSQLPSEPVPWWAYLIVGIVAVVVGLCVEAVVERRAPFGVSRRTYTYVADSVVPTSWHFADWPAVWAGVIAAAVVTILGLVLAWRLVSTRPSR
jgi:hypothetical protein